MNLGGMGVLPGSRAAMNTMMFEQALAPFGGYDLGGMGSYGLSSCAHVYSCWNCEADHHDSCWCGGTDRYDLRGMYGGMSCGVHPYSPYGSMMGVGMMGGGYPYSPSLYNGGHPYSMLHHPHHGVHHGCAMPGRHHPLAHTHHHIHGGYPHSRHHHHGYVPPCLLFLGAYMSKGPDIVNGSMYGGMPPLYDPAFASDVVTSRMMGGMII